MIRKLLLILALFISSQIYSQTLTISNPNLTQPYQVVAGTQVTFNWDYYSTQPTYMFTHDTVPDLVNSQFFPDASWTQHTNTTAVGNGTYNFTTTINNDTYVFGAYSTFMGYSYSNVIYIQTVSSYTVTAADSLICNTSADSVMLTATSDTGVTYQWYIDTLAIMGATDSIYYAGIAGTYYCELTNSNGVNITNSVIINNYPISFSGALNSNNIVMTSDQSFTSYQWYSRTASGVLSPISGATSSTYSAAIDTVIKYYVLEGTTQSGCVLQSIERPVIDTFFTAPVAVLNAQTNSQGAICNGSVSVLKSSGNSGTIQWYKNNSYYADADSLTFYNSYQNGNWYANAVCLNWPEISVSSNTINVNYVDIIDPVLTGTNFNDYYCPNSTLNIILTDEGYNYTWYLHSNYNSYDSTNIISVPNGYYQHTLANSIYITVEAEYYGCTDKTSKYLKSYADRTLNVSLDNYSQRYLCQDSSVNLSLYSNQVSDFQNFQWYQMQTNVWTPLTGDTLSSINVTNPGNYMLTANPIACPSVIDSSDANEIYSYQQRKPVIYTDKESTCEGDTSILRLQSSNQWNALQWLEGEISIGSSGYQKQYVAMLTNTGTDTQYVDTWNSYVISAKHYTCPNGLKVKSDPITIKPKLNPQIVLLDSMAVGIDSEILWDTAQHFVGCEGLNVNITLDNKDFDTILWYHQMYSGNDDYDLGNYFANTDTTPYTVHTEFVTAVVTDSTGCVGWSTPVLFDTYVFQSPTIASYNNAELCSPGDSVLLHLGFPGTWISYQWTNNGVPVPNSNNDTLYAKTPGMYVLNAYPEFCPTVMFSSGVGPTVNYLYASINNYNDSLIYALPFQGVYSYQWYFNGDSIDISHPNTNYILVDSLQPGVYTVEVSNGRCSVMSAAFVWTSIEDDIEIQSSIRVYPNPSTEYLYIESAEDIKINSFEILDMQGKLIRNESHIESNSIYTNDLAKGMYILKMLIDNKFIHTLKFTKE